jgi:hypothetical protein
MKILMMKIIYVVFVCQVCTCEYEPKRYTTKKVDLDISESVGDWTARNQLRAKYGVGNFVYKDYKKGWCILVQDQNGEYNEKDLLMFDRL